MANVLVSSVSKKIPLVKSAREALKRFSPDSTVIGADLDSMCLGRFFVDKFWQMPSIKSLSVDDLIAYCCENSVKFIIPTRDGELPFFAQNRQTLREAGIEVMVSSVDCVALALDKYAFSQIIDHSVPTFLNLSQLKSFPCVAKARYGAGSQSVGVDLTRDEAIEHGSLLTDAVYQPFINGTEISVDLYVRIDGGIHGMVCRERDLIVQGESQVTTTFRCKEVEDLCTSAAMRMRLNGHVMFQLIRENSSGLLHLIECNPRFGGASTASVRVGLDSFYWFFCEAEQRPLPPYKRLDKEVKMIRHPEDIFIDL